MLQEKPPFSWQSLNVWYRQQKMSGNPSKNQCPENQGRGKFLNTTESFILILQGNYADPFACPIS
jgi:hypothetical protein